MGLVTRLSQWQRSGPPGRWHRALHCDLWHL